MLDGIIRGSLRQRLLVVVAALALAGYGAWVAAELPIDVLPDLNRPTVTILTEAHGLSPVDVEQQITWPIELSMNGATGVERVRSTSGNELSVVYVEFGWDTEIYRNRQIVQEKLQLARAQLPPDAHPQLAPISSIMGQIQLVGVRWKDKSRSASELRALVDQVLKPRLVSVKGAAQVVSIGGAPRQLQVVMDAARLRAYGLGVAEVADAVERANRAGSGGWMETGPKGPLVAVTGRATGPADVRDAVVSPSGSGPDGDNAGRPVTVGDLASVSFGPAAQRTGDAGINGERGVILVVFKQPETDTVALSDRIERELASMAEAHPDLEFEPGLYRQADFIRRAVGNVTEAVRDGSILVLLVLFLFLMNLRTTFITLTAIPLSIAVTAVVFKLLGVSINTMTLGGLSVAIGALVDDAIVDVENVFRRLRQRPDVKPFDVVFAASSEVRRPILIGTLVVAAAYLPLFALTGMEGRLFTPIGVAYIVSILASLVVSLTVTPVLCFYLLPAHARAHRDKTSWAVRKLQGGADRLIRVSLSYPRAIGAVVLALVVACLVIAGTRGREFLPPFNEGTAQVNLVLPPGTSLETSDAAGFRVEKSILSVKGVQSVARRTGRAEGDEHAFGVHTTESIVTFDPNSGRTREETLGDIRTRLDEEFPGVTKSTEQPLAHLLSHLLSGVTAQVAIKVFGDDLAVLRRIGKEAEAAIRGIPGVVDVFAEQQVLVERIEVRPRRDDLARYGIDVAALAGTVELALEGATVSRLIRGRASYPIIVRLQPEDRRDMGAIRALRLRTSAGESVRLDAVADVVLAKTPNNINREAVSRRFVVSHNVQDRSLGEVVADVEKRLEPVRASLPPGYSIKLGGQFEAQRNASRVILLLSLVSFGGMLLLLYLHFRSLNLALQVLASIPMAFLGAVAFVVATGQTISVATLVGLVSLGGIAARNAILLLDHYLHLMREEGESFSHEMLRRAGRERIVPVVMTALTSGIALVPLVLAPGQPGRELLYPVASVIVGGLFTATLLDVLLTPGIFWLFGRRVAERVHSAKEPTQ